MRIAAYLRARIGERSTWAGIGAAIVGGSALPAPFSWLAVGAGIVAVLMPTKASV